MNADSTITSPPEHPPLFRRRRRPQRKRRDRILIFSREFGAEAGACGHRMSDVAVELARRGYRVRVYTAKRAPTIAHGGSRSEEDCHGVEVIRLPLCRATDHKSLKRALHNGSFMAQAFVRGLFLPNVAGVMVGTSPPLIGMIATILRVFRGMPIVYWAMDLSPDRLLAIRKIAPGSMAARLMESIHRTIMNNSTLVVALDRFMADRLYPRARLDDKLVVIPPWPHEVAPEPPGNDDNSFRRQHNLDGKFIVVCSGSDSLPTVFDAAARLTHDDSIKFLFIGGGIEIEKHFAQQALPNVVRLPDQPAEALRALQRAADVHVVSMADSMVGIIHPCEVYTPMAAGRPVLYVGPKPSPITDLLDREDFGRSVAHGDVDGCIAAIQNLKQIGCESRNEMGVRGKRYLSSRLSQEILCKRFCDGLELAFEKRM